jgi:hypothetical protein
MKNVEQLIFYVVFNNKLLILVSIPQSTKYKVLCKYLISIEKGILSISAPSIYSRGTYGQSIKLEKKPRTLIFKIFATVEK